VQGLTISDAKLVESKRASAQGAEKVTIRLLISEKDGAPHFQMRLFEVGPGGRTPLHRHDWEHEVFILEGEGMLVFEGEEKSFSSGYFAYVPAGAEHSFVNTGSGSLEFLCIIPAPDTSK
jgi:quercetin dioxygenase-like cupin family protein